MYNIKKILGSNIKKYRKRAHLTQETLAEKLDISSKHLSSIEVGQKFISAQLLEKLIEIFEIPPHSLFYTSDAEYTHSYLDKIDTIVFDEAKQLIGKIKLLLHEEA